MPDRAFTVKPMYRSLPKRDWRRTRSQSILIAMEVFSWRSGPVGFGRTEDRPLQRSKTLSAGVSESYPDYPGQILRRSTPTQVIQGSNCLSLGPKDNNRRMTIEHAECSIQSTLRALAISTSQHPALLFIDIQKLFGCPGLHGINQVKLGPLRSSSAVNTR